MTRNDRYELEFRSCAVEIGSWISIDRTYRRRAGRREVMTLDVVIAGQIHR